jgi:hypothetical protein
MDRIQSGEKLLSGVLNFRSFVSSRNLLSAEYLGFNVRSVNNINK